MLKKLVEYPRYFLNKINSDTRYKRAVSGNV